MLNEKVAIVSGGTRGIGFEVVRTFIKNGAKVILLGSRKETVDMALNKLNEEGLNAEGYYPNLMNYDEIAKMMEEIYNKYHKIDILVNNAGIAASKIIEETSSYDF